ncbi:S-layer homology domain-containing protein [Lederbergia citrisecunda]|uniref:S-layer homology domain-containing protein n=1 Tax=Lederbergia citrisecunda TaxID=2833583 RepID=UPI003D2A0C3A
MANQPTKYRKFVVGAASAALVASAVAPVASAATFSDVSEGNSHKASIDALVAKGVISGYPDGTFKPTQTLKRSDVVKMMGKWLKSEGYTAAADYKTNPRFSDLKSTSNDELLEMAALVKDNGLFIGLPDGSLDPNGPITRENMAVVIVRAFDTVHNIDLATYVAGQEFKKDVVDLGKAKAEARPAINVLDYFDITNPAAPSFNPKDTTNRAQFASFLNKAIETDYSEVASGVVGDVAVKAVNATTVEVTFKDAVENVNSLNFTIEGLTVSNAAVKQSDNKTVVLTTAVQEGGKKYTVSLDNKEIGTFEGISAVVPSKIDITTQSVQGKVGQQAIVSADVGVKQAGIPVTFNVKADTNNTLNKDQVFESVTNADGIATFSYTQYAAGNDQVIAYPTGAPAVRDLGYVFWGVDTILSVKANDEKGDKLKNGENKIYTVTYLNPKTGKPQANEKLNVTFAENVDTVINQTTNATINGVTPLQLTNGKVEAVTVTTNSKGEATFTVSGSNTKATPIVFVDGSDSSKANSSLEASELQAKASELTFGATQAEYTIEVTRDGGEEAAIGTKDGGRDYKVVVKDKDGKVAANEWVQVAFNEDIDRIINTNTQAYFVDANGNEVSDPRTKAYSVKTNSKGEAKFTIASKTKDDYATPVVWIDINSSNAKEGKLDDGEPFKVADITYFAEPKLTSGVLKAYNEAGEEVDEDEFIKGTEPATFRYSAANQSGKAMSLNSNYTGLEVSFTVFNTGNNDIRVNGELVSPSRSYTVPGTDRSSITVTSVDNKTTSVRVEATGTAIGKTNVQNVYLGNKVVNTNFKSTTEVGTVETGLVETLNTKDKKIKIFGKDSISYKDATFYNVDNSPIRMDVFETLVTESVTPVTIKKDGDKVSITILSTYVPTPEENDRKQLAAAVTLVDTFVKDNISSDGVAPGTPVTLPAAVGTSGDTASVTWKLGNAAVAGPIALPTKAGNYNLTATITKGGLTAEKTYTVKVLKVINTDSIEYTFDSSNAAIGEVTVTFTTLQDDLTELAVAATRNLENAFGAGTTATAEIKDNNKLVITVTEGTGTDRADITAALTAGVDFDVVFKAKDVPTASKTITLKK